MSKQLPSEYWAYVTASGALLPSTVREKEGDSRSALHKTDAKYRANDLASYRLVRVRVDVVND